MMNRSGNTEMIAERFASLHSWRGMRVLLRTHHDSLTREGVVIQKRNGKFSLARYFEAWESEGEGIKVVFSKDEKKVCIISCIVRREGSVEYYEASINEPGLQKCLVAVLIGVPPDIDKLHIRTFAGKRAPLIFSSQRKA